MARRLVLASVLTACLPKIAPVLQASAGRNLLLEPTAAVGEGWYPEDTRHIAPFERMGFRVRVLDLSASNVDETQTRHALSATDAVYVCGGNTFFLLEHMRRTGFDRMVGLMVDHGLLYVGTSAGAVVAQPDIGYASSLDDPSRAMLVGFAGLGLVPFPPLPHMGHPTYGEAVAELYAAGNGDGASFLGLADDHVAIIDGTSFRVA